MVSHSGLEKGQLQRIKEKTMAPPLLSPPLSVSEGWNAEQDGNRPPEQRSWDGFLGVERAFPFPVE